MNTLKSVVIMILVIIALTIRGFLRLCGRDLKPMKWDDEPAINIPFENEKNFKGGNL